MFVEEARWIMKTIEHYGPKRPGHVLDAGSSNKKYRTVTQPHIHELIHKPLLDAGHRLYFLDMKIDEGIDIVVDLTSDRLPAGIFEDQYGLVICCNILEHVRNRTLFIKNLLRFTAKGSLLLLTVPHSYPRHNDPIDTMYRPTVTELLTLVRQFKAVELLKGSELVISDKAYYQRQAGRLLDYVLLRTVRLRARWYFPFLRWRVTCALVRVE